MASKFAILYLIVGGNPSIHANQLDWIRLFQMG